MIRGAGTRGCQPRFVYGVARFGFQDSGLGFRDLGFGFQSSDFEFRDSGSGHQGTPAAAPLMAWSLASLSAISWNSDLEGERGGESEGEGERERGRGRER